MTSTVSPQDAPPRVDERLQAEAAFQNERVRADGEEPREKYYYLVERAFERYHGALAALGERDVVVVGCSADAMPAWLLERSYVTGVDIADEAIEQLNGYIAEHGLGHRARALVMNGEDLSLEGDSRDAIVCSGVLHHLDVERAAANWAHVLRPDGEVLMLEPMAWNPAAALYRLLTPSMRTHDEHPLVPRDLRILRRHFQRVHVEAYALTTMLSLPWVFLPDPFGLRDRMQRFLAPVDRFLFRALPFLKYFAWTVFIRCSRPRC